MLIPAQAAGTDSPGSKGYGEAHPRPDIPGEDGRNRRVELIFFDPGEQPSAGELDALYDPEQYGFQPIPSEAEGTGG